MCDCIEKIEQRIRLEKNTDHVGMMRKGWSEVQFTPYTQKGNLARHNHYQAVDWKFCPFCGNPKDD